MRSGRPIPATSRCKFKWLLERAEATPRRKVTGPVVGGSVGSNRRAPQKAKGRPHGCAAALSESGCGGP
jgi:hypothetical protein